MSQRIAPLCGLVLVAVLLVACGTQPTVEQPTAPPPMSLTEAQQIAAQSSECMQVGRTTPRATYNPNSNTWWIDLDATAQGCNPACVVDVATKTAEVVWRCTGAAVPPNTTPDATPAADQNNQTPNPASMALAGNYIGQAPAADAPGQIVQLTLVPDKTAALTNQFIGKGAPMVQSGTWLYTANGITVTIKDNPPMVFMYDNGTLILQNVTEAGYGPNGLTLTRTPSGQTNTAEYGGVKIAFDAELAQSAKGETMAATPSACEGSSLCGATPAAIRFLFDGAIAQNYFDPHLAQVLVYKTADWVNLDPSTAQVVSDLKSLLLSKPASYTGTLPLLPPISASQVFHAKDQYLDFHNGSGIGYITAYKQDVSPLTASQIFYTFQGLTNDGQYYVAAFYPISTTLLPAQDNMTGEEYQQFFQEYDSYLVTVTEQLNELLPAGYVPDLRLIEDLMRSIEIGNTTLP